MAEKTEKINIVIDTKIEGADAIKHLAKIEKQLRKLEKPLKQLQKTFKTVHKSIKQMTKLSDRLTKRQTAMTGRINKATVALRKQNKQLKDNARNAQKAERSTKRLGLSLRSIAGIGAFAFAFRRAQNLADAGIRAALKSPGISQQIAGNLGKDQSPTSALKFIGAAIGDSLPLQFQGTNETTKALLAIGDKIKFLGPDQSGGLVGEFIKGFQGQQKDLFRFLADVNSKGVKQAIEASLSAQRLLPGRQLLNALQIQKQAKDGTSDPVMKAQLAIKLSVEKLGKSLDELIITLATKIAPLLEKFANLSPNKQAGLLGGAVLAGSVGGSVLGGLARGGRAAGRGGLAGARGLGGLAGRGIGAIGGSKAAQGLGLVMGKGGIAGLVAGGIALDAIGTALVIKETVGLVRDKIALGAATTRNTGLQDQFARIIAENESNASTPLAKLLAKRQATDLKLTQATDTKSNSFKALQSSRNALTARIKALRSETEAIKATTQAVEKATAVQKSQRSVLESNRLQIDALQKPLERVGLETQLLKTQANIAQQSVFGNLLSIDELQNVNVSLNKQISVLEKIASLTDTSNETGKINRLKIENQIQNLRLEQSVNLKSIRQSVLTGFISEAFGAGGAFEKILLTQTQNLGKGLEQGLIKAPAILAGQLGNKGLTPISPQSLYPDQSKIFQTIEDTRRGRRRAPVARTSGTNESELLSASAENLKRAAKQRKLEEQREYAQIDFKSDHPGHGLG